jgi:DNA-binding MarR family transcriptional regulator
MIRAVITMKQQESVGKWVSALYRHIQIKINKELDPYKMSSGVIHVYMTLLNNDGINQDSVAKKLDLDKATVGRAIEKLIKIGYVSRETDKIDHRAYNLHVTKKGKDIEIQVRKVLNSLTKTLLSDFNVREKDLALEFLKRMFYNLQSIENK